MSNESDYEIKYVFGLLDPTNTREIHVQEINQIVQALENLSPDRKRSNTMGAPIENDSVPIKKPVKEADKKTSLYSVNSFQKPIIATRGIRKAINEGLNNNNNNENHEKNKVQEIKQVQSHGKAMDLLEAPEKEKSEFQLKQFPNRKKTMNSEEFSELYQDVFHNNAIKEDVLLKCFSIFDYEK